VEHDGVLHEQDALAPTQASTPPAQPFDVAGFWLIFRGFFDHNDVAAMVWGGDAMTIGGIALAAWARYHLGPLLERARDAEGRPPADPQRAVPAGAASAVHGILTGGVGSAITAGTWYGFVGFVLVVAAVMIKIYREEDAARRRVRRGVRAVQGRETATLIPFVY
jgi:hypothetical protein